MTGADNCTVEFRCSSGGLLCASSDRACLEQARARSLEISCETASEQYVYCPDVGSSADHPVLWILLAVAFLIAIGGTGVAWYALRGGKKTAE